MKLARATDAAAAAPDRICVTPTQRLAHELRARHDADCLARGLEVWPTPEVLSWPALIERLFQLERQAGRIRGRWLSGAAVQLLWERIVREDAELDPLLSPAGIARAAVRAWQLLHDHEIPLDEIAADDSPETTAFIRWSGRYSGLLDRKGWVDGAWAQQRVNPVPGTPALTLAGFERLLPVQASALQRWSASGVEIETLPAAGPASRVTWRTCLDASAEVEAAVRWAAAQLHGGVNRRIAIVVPDLPRRQDAVRRIVDRVLSPATGLAGGPMPGCDFELAAAKPFAEQPLVAAALDLLDMHVRSPDLAAISRLLRSPFVAGAAAEASARALLDGRVRRFENAGLGLGGLATLAAAADCPRLAEALDASRKVMQKWPDNSLPSQCINSVFDLLSSLGWPPEPLDSEAYQVNERWRTLVAELGACDEFTGGVSAPEVAGLLREIAGRVLFEPQVRRAPLLLIDAETCIGMRFDALWVCGLDATRWPPGAAPDPLLPRALQIRHGLPRASPELAARWAEDTLRSLLVSADAVILSAPQVDGDAPLLPSPLITGLPASGELDSWSAPRAAAFLFQDRPALEQTVDARMPPLADDESAAGGVRLLELQSACPLRAQAELRLGATPLEEPALGIGAAERGSLVHDALAILWGELGGQAALLALDEQALRSTVRRAIAAALEKARRGATAVLHRLLEIEADWLAERMLELIDADRRRAPFSIEAIEQSRTALVGPLTLAVRPDRVDRLADGSLAVIDYKTGGDAVPAAWLGERPRLPQLPAYVQALGPERVSAVSFGRVRSGDTGFVGLSRTSADFGGLKVPGEKGGPKGFDSWEQLLAEWQRRLAVLAEEYTSGDARLAINPADACRYCHLPALCRIGETRSSSPADADVDE